MRGGYRSGGGRPKGSKDKKPRKMTAAARAKAELEAAQLKEDQRKAQVEADRDAQVSQIQQLLSVAQQAKGKIVRDFLFRVANKDGKQKPLSVIEMRHMEKLRDELEEEAGRGGVAVPGVSEGLDPLTYMLRIMNDPKEDPAVRRQMAAAAAPYIHPKAGESGKKEEKTERAAVASRGKYAAGKPPLALVK